MKFSKNEIQWKCFVNNIVWLRNHYEFSKERMAEICGITVTTLNKIENSEMPEELSIEIIMKVSTFFSISPKDLFAPPHL